MNETETKERLHWLHEVSKSARARMQSDYEDIKVLSDGTSEQRVAVIRNRWPHLLEMYGEQPLIAPNFLWDFARNLLALYVSAGVKATVVAYNNDQDAVRKAKAGTLVFDDFWHRVIRRSAAGQRVAMEMIHSGTAILKLSWDAFRGPLREVMALKPDGRPRFDGNRDSIGPTEGVTMEPSGDIRPEVLTPWDVWLDPSVPCMNDLQDIVHEFYLDPWQVRARWPKVNLDEVQPVAMESKKSAPGDDADAAKSARKQYRVIEYFRRPDIDHKAGRHVLMVGDVDKHVVMVDEDLAIWPFASVVAVPRTSRSFWGTPPLVNALDYQAVQVAAFNRVEMAFLKLGHPAWERIQSGLNEDNAKVWSFPGSVVPSGLKPLPPIGIPFVMLQWMDKIYSDAQTSSSVTPAMMGKEANPHASGRLQGILEDSALRVFAPAGELWEVFVEDVGTIALALLWEYGGEVMTVGGLGRNNPEVKELTRDKWAKGQVRVQAGSGLPRNKAIAQQFIMQVVEMGLAQDLAPRQLREILDMPSLSTDVDDVEDFKRYANARLDRMETDPTFIWDVQGQDRNLVVPDVLVRMARGRVFDSDFESLHPDSQKNIRNLLEIAVQLHAEFMGQMDPYGQGGGGEEAPEGQPPEPAPLPGQPQPPGQLPGQPLPEMSASESYGVNPFQEVSAGMGDIPA